MTRGMAVPALVLAIAMTAIGAITVVHKRADAARDAERTLADIKTELGQLQTAPFRANTTGATRRAMRRQAGSTQLGSRRRARGAARARRRC